jgi:hypothetical protein
MEQEFLNNIEDNHIGGEHLAPEIQNDFGIDTDFSQMDWEKLQGGEVVQEEPEQPNNVSPGSIDPKLATSLLDTLFCTLLVLVLRYAGKDAKKSELKATEAEKRQLEPLISNCLKSINWNIENPWSALAVSCLFIYGSKVLVNWEDMEDRAGAPSAQQFTPGEHLSPEAFNQPAKRKRGRPRKNF